MSALDLLLDDFDFGINAKQKILVESIFAGLPKAAALARAGYTPSTDVRKMIDDNPNMRNYANYLQEQERKKWSVTREQVTQGMMEAINDAKVLEEPNTQINGWRELGRLHGLYAPEEKKVTLSAEKSERLRQIEEASDEALLDMAEAPVIEGDFEQIG